MIREFSAGALVLRFMQDQWWTAVIEPGREGEPEERKNVLALPKGNVDKGEKPPPSGSTFVGSRVNDALSAYDDQACQGDRANRSASFSDGQGL